MDILALLQCLQGEVSMTTIRQFSHIALAMLAMTGRVTMLGISRWAGPGGSYRTVQRFFSQALPWAMLFWVFLRQHVYRAAEHYRLVGDEVVATQAGKITHGRGRFFASLYGQPVPGLACFTLSLVSSQQGESGGQAAHILHRQASARASKREQEPSESRDASDPRVRAHSLPARRFAAPHRRVSPVDLL